MSPDRILHLTLLLTAVAGSGCSRGSDEPGRGAETALRGDAVSEIAIRAETAPSAPLPLPRTVEKADGLRVEILADGAGAAIEGGGTALIRYESRLQGSESILGSTKGWFEPLAVPIGATAAPARAAIVPGLARGLEGLRVGSRARIEIPPALAYGVLGAPGAGVPADATLVYEVEVVGVRR